MSKIKNFQGTQTPRPCLCIHLSYTFPKSSIPSCFAIHTPHPPSKAKTWKSPDSVWYWFANQSQKVVYYLHKYELLIQCINLPCLCLFLGIHSLRRYEARGEPNFCCLIADGFVGAANPLTVSRNRLGRLIGICGYLEVNVSHWLSIGFYLCCFKKVNQFTIRRIVIL